MSPVLTLLVAVAAGEEDAARRTLASVRRQDLDDWQLVLVGDLPPEDDDPRVLLLPRPDGSASPTAAALDAGLAAATGGHTGVLGAGDELEPGALGAVAAMLDDADVLYTDEQWPGDGGSGIARKPDFLPIYLAGYPYTGRLCLIRTELAREVGGFRPGFDGAEEWDLVLRATDGDARVRHLPAVAVTRPAGPATDEGTADAGVRVVQDRIDRTGRAGTAERTTIPLGVRTWWTVDEPPLVSVVIPTAGGRRTVGGEDGVLVERCLRGLVGSTTYPRWEAVLATSAHTPPDVVERCREIVGDRLVVAPVEGAFNFSASVNTGAAAAHGDLILLLNDDTEPVEPRWLDRMVSVVQDPRVGVVGAKLLFEDGTLQHVGVSVDDAGDPTHVLMKEADDAGRFGTKTVDVDYEAVTGACLLVTREVFEQVGGFCEELPLNFNDLDFCLKVRAAGRAVVCTNAAVLHHYESSSRGRSAPSEAEHALIGRRWGLRRRLDPHVNYRSDL